MPASWAAPGSTSRTATDGPSCLVAGQPASLDEGIERAASFCLRRAIRWYMDWNKPVARPCGWPWHRRLDRRRSGHSWRTPGWPGRHVVARRGEVTCSLGEIANRADLVLVWRADPLVNSSATFQPIQSGAARAVRARRPRRPQCVVIDSQPHGQARRKRICSCALPAGCDFEALWILRGLVRGAELPADEVLAATGVALTAWQDLCDRLQAGEVRGDSVRRRFG